MQNNNSKYRKIVKAQFFLYSALDRGESFEIFCSEQKIWERSCFGSGILFASGKGASGMSIIVYFVMITECGNEKVARSVIHRIKLVILEDITDSGE